MNVSKKFSKEINEVLADHGEWAKPSFGNGIAGLMYGLLTAIGIGLYYVGGVWISMATIPSFVLFWILCKYDTTLVSIWNEREKERVVAQWITKNIDRVMEDSSQVIVSEGNLDGTNGDE